jgi:hypothetical protein
MPGFPQDMDKARAKAVRDLEARKARETKAAASAAADREMVRAAANELRARAGQPPLRDDEPVMGFFCRRGRKP